MISDALWEAHYVAQQYLSDPDFREAYQGDLRARIVALLTEMDAVRRLLDEVGRQGLHFG